MKIELCIFFGPCFRRNYESLCNFDLSAVDYLHILDRFIVDVCFDVFNGAKNIHTFQYFSEDHVLAVQPWGLCEGDKELATIGVGAWNGKKSATNMRNFSWFFQFVNKAHIWVVMGVQINIPKVMIMLKSCYFLKYFVILPKFRKYLFGIIIFEIITFHINAFFGIMTFLNIELYRHVEFYCFS